MSKWQGRQMPSKEFRSCNHHIFSSHYNNLLQFEVYYFVIFLSSYFEHSSRYSQELLFYHLSTLSSSGLKRNQLISKELYGWVWIWIQTTSSNELCWSCHIKDIGGIDIWKKILPWKENKIFSCRLKSHLILFIYQYS